MLHVINNHTVRDSSGFTVSVRDIHYVDYTEGERTCTVEIEGAAGDAGTDWCIYSTSLTGWKDREDDPMTMPEKVLILKRISACLDQLNMKNRIE